MWQHSAGNGVFSFWMDFRVYTNENFASLDTIPCLYICCYLLYWDCKADQMCCFPFTDKRIGKIMGVAIFESFSFSMIIFFNLDNFSTLYNDILIKSNSKWISFKVNLSWLQNYMLFSIPWLSVITTMLPPTCSTLKQPAGDDSLVCDPNCCIAST